MTQIENFPKVKEAFDDIKTRIENFPEDVLRVAQMNPTLLYSLIAGVIIFLLSRQDVPVLSEGKRLIESKVNEMAKAIQSFEGWFAGSVSFGNNNPGNLKYAGQAGAIGQDAQGHAIFTTFEAGWNALIAQLVLAITGKSRVYTPNDTFYDFFSKYAEANSADYANFVAGRLGVNPQATLKDTFLA